MSDSTGIYEYYHVVVRRGAVGPRPFVWEIRHKDTARMMRGSEQPFAIMEVADRSGYSALERLSNTSAARLP
jgi:AraC-like DNA-binding protein